MTKILFENAPLTEVVIGVQFESDILDNVDIFEYYQIKKALFPKITENPPLIATIENINSDNLLKSLSGFNSRKFFIEQEEHKLIQVQKDRLVFNWRALSVGVYPHFENILPEFITHLNDLNGISKIIDNINQLEFTYVNQIELAQFDLGAFNLPRIFKFVAISQDLKSFNFNLAIPFSEINGNLNYKLHSALRLKDNKPLIVCETTVRGMLISNKTIETWFTEAHEIALKFFVDTITDEAKKYGKQKGYSRSFINVWCCD